MTVFSNPIFCAFVCFVFLWAAHIHRIVDARVRYPSEPAYTRRYRQASSKFPTPRTLPGPAPTNSKTSISAVLSGFFLVEAGCWLGRTSALPNHAHNIKVGSSTRDRQVSLEKGRIVCVIVRRSARYDEIAALR